MRFDRELNFACAQPPTGGCRRQTLSSVMWLALITMAATTSTLAAQTANAGTRPPVSHTGEGNAITLNAQLDRLYERGVEYARKLSKITCKERIHSEQNSTGFSMTVHWKLDTRGEFRVVRAEGGVAGFKDAHRFTEKNGVTIPETDKIDFPYILNDAFAPAILSYLAPERRSCLHFTMRGGRVDFATVAGMGGHGKCADIAPDAKGYVLFDRVTETVSHFERAVPLQSSLAGNWAPFAAVDYSPYGFKGRLMMLPSHIAATKSTGTLNYLFDGTYTGCDLFDSIVVIRGSDGKVIPNP